MLDAVLSVGAFVWQGADARDYKKLQSSLTRDELGLSSSTKVVTGPQIHTWTLRAIFFAIRAILRQSWNSEPFSLVSNEKYVNLWNG